MDQQLLPPMRAKLSIKQITIISRLFPSPVYPWKRFQAMTLLLNQILLQINPHQKHKIYLCLMLSPFSTPFQTINTLLWFITQSYAHPLLTPFSILSSCLQRGTFLRILFVFPIQAIQVNLKDDISCKNLSMLVRNCQTKITLLTTMNDGSPLLILYIL